MAFDSTYQLSVKRIECLSESSNDQSTPADEIYFLADAFDPTGETGNLASRVYTDVNSGQAWDIDTDGRGYQNGKLNSTRSRLVWPHRKIGVFEGQQMLSVFLKMWEEDNGDYLEKADEYFNNQYKKLSDLEKINTVENGGFMQSSYYWGNLSNRPPAGESQIFKEINRFFSQDVLGLDDDFIGEADFVITDIDDVNNRFYIKFGAGREGWHMFGSPFSIYINGGSEGRYTLYLEFDATRKGTDLNAIEKIEKIKHKDADAEEKQAEEERRVLIALMKELSDSEWDVVFSGAPRSTDYDLLAAWIQSACTFNKAKDAIKNRQDISKAVNLDLLN